MAELDPDDVESFTGGRLAASDPEVTRLLNAALAAARRHCGWHVSPVIEDDSVVLDGPCSRQLVLPTRKLVELTSIVEDGSVQSLNTLHWSAGGPPGALSRPVVVRKKSNRFWSEYYSSIAVTMTHGYTEDEAADWRFAILSMVDQMSAALTSGRGDLDMVSKKVDDVTYQWANPYAALAESAVFSMSSTLESYQLPPLEFL